MVRPYLSMFECFQMKKYRCDNNIRILPTILAKVKSYQKNYRFEYV